MIETDHDMRKPADMLVTDRIAKGVFHLPGIARVQAITRPLRPYGPRPLVRALLLPKEPDVPDSASASANTDRFPVAAPHY